MSAREELEREWHYVFAPRHQERVSALLDKMLDEHAHKLAEKIRGLQESQPSHWAGIRIDVAADLIDPEVNE